MSFEYDSIYCMRVAGFYETFHLRAREYYIKNEREFRKRVE